MAKERTGSIVKRKPRRKGDKPSWWARVTYIDPVTGKRRDLQRRADNKADAKDRVHELIKEIDTTDGRTLAHERKTFSHLADYYEKHYLKPAEYVEGRKISGLRSLKGLSGQLNAARVIWSCGHRLCACFSRVGMCLRRAKYSGSRIWRARCELWCRQRRKLRNQV